MKAWMIEKELISRSKPKLLSEEEQTWTDIGNVESEEDRKTRLLWYSEVPGSGARERLIIAAIQDTENRGRNVSAAEELILEGLDAYEKNDMVRLNQITSEIFYSLRNAPKDFDSDYWKHTEYKSWSDFEASCTFPEAKNVDVESMEFGTQIYAGWLSQIIGGAFGTALEGYTTENLRNTFGEINRYLRKPNTFNDDITYELAFLKAFEKKGYDVRSKDIALEWVGYIPSGWSAEDVALRNIKFGIFPPESGTFNNPFCEWIGAQMRGAICGMAAPGNPREAARLAWLDGEVSHSGNGIIGEVFNAVITSLAFVYNNVQLITEMAIRMLPPKSEYYSVVNFAYETALSEGDWKKAWAACEKKYERYNWIHAYPNAAAEIIALMYGGGDFDKTMNIIGEAGQDVDCNAAQIATVIGIAKGLSVLSEKWTEPIGDELDTYLRVMKKLTISGLSNWTAEAVRKANRGV